MKYQEFIDSEWIKPSEKSYIWSGENALFRGTENGEEIYGGLGLVENEADFRTELMNNYNSAFNDIFIAEGVMKVKMLGEIFLIPVTKIEPGPEAEDKIQWVKILRLKH